MEKSAGVVIFRNNNGREYLLLKYNQPLYWDYTKGHIEPGESEIDAAIRETREETGLTGINILSGFREKISYYFSREGKIIYKEVVFFTGETHKGEIKISPEHEGYEWLPYEAALERLTYPKSREILRKAEKFIKGKCQHSEAIPQSKPPLQEPHHNP